MNEYIHVTKNRARIVRVGYANVLFFVALMFSILANQALIDFAVENTIRAISMIVMTLCWVKLYLACVGEIGFVDEALNYSTAISRKSILLNDISNIKTFTIPSSMMLIISIKETKKFLPTLLILISPKTNKGTFGETVQVVEENVGRILGANRSM